MLCSNMRDDLTVCVTTFRRPERVAAAIASVQAAGLSRIVQCDGEEYGSDLGCNNTWMVAAYRARTKRIVILHDDDLLKPEFGKAYNEIIGPCMDCRDAGAASWRAELRYDDGHTEATEWFPKHGCGSTVVPSSEIGAVVGHMGRLSLSPVVSVLNRAITIRACKEAFDHLRSNDSYERPGMLLGTEILVYLRHIQYFKRWLFVDQVLAQYGSHAGSGTVRAQQLHHENILIKGYDLARKQALCPAPTPRPNIILVHSPYEAKDQATKERQHAAQESWRWHFANGDFVDSPYHSSDVPTARELFDDACRVALPEDVILYANEDAGLAVNAYEKVIAAVARGSGVACLGGHALDILPSRPFKTLRNYRQSGGIEAIAFTPSWWKLHRDRMPAMHIGREGWDTVFAALAEEWADGCHRPTDRSFEGWTASKAHASDIVFHVEHRGYWEDCRTTDPLNIANREMARAFFNKLGDHISAELFR